MAASYRVVYQNPGIQTFAPNAPINVIEVGFFTDPSNVYAQVYVPTFNWNNDGAAAWIQPLADGIEAELARPEIAGMAWAQDLDKSGQLQDYMDITVQYVPTGPQIVATMQADVRVPVYAWTTGQGVDALVNIPVGKALAALTATANL